MDNLFYLLFTFRFGFVNKQLLLLLLTSSYWSLNQASLRPFCHRNNNQNR